jgi:hypothetical protein
VAYCNNDVLHYSLKTNQFYIGHRPEFSMMYAHGQGGMKISVSYRGRAHMTGHAYHGYAYDPVVKQVLVCGQTKTMVKGKHYFVYDPTLGDWTGSPINCPFMPNYNTTAICSTPKGAVIWHGNQLFIFDASDQSG